MNRKYCSIAVAVALGFVCVQTLFAQEKPPLRLSLVEAVQVALRQNPQVQIAHLEVATSREDQSIAHSALLPQANLQVSDAATRRNLKAFIGRRLPGMPQHAGPFQTFQAGPGFSVPVFDLTLWRHWQAAGKMLDRSQSQELTVREQTTLLVVSKYLGSLRAAAGVSAAQSRVNLAQALYDQAVGLQAEGISTALDTLRANVELQNEKQRLIVAETSHKTALYGLAQLLNLEPEENVELQDEKEFFETPEFTLEKGVESAYAHRPELQALSARESAVALEKQAAGEARLPKVVAGGNWGYQGTSASSSIPAYQYQVTLEVPLFTSGRIRAENTQAALELEKLDRQIKDLKSRIALDVKTAAAQFDSARHEVEVANLGLQLAREEVNDARERFQAGVANNIEVITAQDALSRASDNQIGALYNYNQARASLAHATGQIENLYSH
jgi:outer membrane protein